MKTILSCNSAVVKSSLIASHAHPSSPPSPPPQEQQKRKPPLIAFTTPSNYADRLSKLLTQKLTNHRILWCPTVIVESTPHTQQSLLQHLSPTTFQDFSAIAFTSRTGIISFSEILQLNPPLLPETAPQITISALGKDAELLTPHFISKLCSNPNRIKILVPPQATPTSMVESLNNGYGRKILCPVPEVIGLHEPAVVSDFIRGLAENGWVPVRVSAYETRWAGVKCAEALLEEEVDAIVFTSTAEVEGLLKSLRALGFEWEMLVERYPGLIVAAHGPVTAAGAKNLGVNVDVVSSKFGSFDGVVDALARKLY